MRLFQPTPLMHPKAALGHNVRFYTAKGMFGNTYLWMK